MSLPKDYQEWESLSELLYKLASEHPKQENTIIALSSLVCRIGAQNEIIIGLLQEIDGSLQSLKPAY